MKSRIPVLILFVHFIILPSTAQDEQNLSSFSSNFSGKLISDYLIDSTVIKRLSVSDDPSSDTITITFEYIYNGTEQIRRNTYETRNGIRNLTSYAIYNQIFRDSRQCDIVYRNTGLVNFVNCSYDTIINNKTGTVRSNYTQFDNVFKKSLFISFKKFNEKGIETQDSIVFLLQSDIPIFILQNNFYDYDDFDNQIASYQKTFLGEKIYSRTNEIRYNSYNSKKYEIRSFYNLGTSVATNTIRQSDSIVYQYIAENIEIERYNDFNNPNRKGEVYSKTIEAPFGPLDIKGYINHSILNTLYLFRWTKYYYRNLTNTQDIEDAEIKIFPNPANDIINFSVSEVHIELMDFSGKILQKEFVQTNSINTQNLPAGVYFIKFLDSNLNKLAVKKFIKI